MQVETREIYHPLITEPLTGFTNFAQAALYRFFRVARHALCGPHRVALYKASQDAGALFWGELIHSPRGLASQLSNRPTCAVWRLAPMRICGTRSCGCGHVPLWHRPPILARQGLAARQRNQPLCDGFVSRLTYFSQFALVSVVGRGPVEAIHTRKSFPRPTFFYYSSLTISASPSSLSRANSGVSMRCQIISVPGLAACTPSYHAWIALSAASLSL